MRSPSKKRTSTKERESTERIRELEEKLAASVPKAEFETVKTNMQLEINGLKTRLSAAEVQVSRRDLSEPRAIGQLDEDGFEEREADGLTAEISQIGSSTEGLTTGDSEESETTDLEDREDSDEPETAESCVQSRTIDQSPRTA